MAVLSPSLKKTHVSGKGVAGPIDQKSLYTGPIDTTWPGKLGVGRGFNNTYFNGEINEILVYNRVLSADEAASVEKYLRNKFGTE